MQCAYGLPNFWKDNSVMKAFTWVIAAIAVTASFASPSYAFAGFVGSRSIIGIDVGDTNSLIIRLSGDPICQGTTFVRVSRSDAWYNDMLAMALSAYGSGKSINVWVSACEGETGRVLRMVQGTVY